MKQRTITASLIIAVVLVAFLLREFVSNFIFDALFCAVIIVACNEVARVFNRSGRSNDSLLITMYPIFNYLLFYFCLKGNIKIGYILLLSLALIAVLMCAEMVIILLTKKQLKTEYENNKAYKTFFDFCVYRVFLTGFIMLYPSLILSSIYYFNHIAEFTYLDVATNFANINMGLFLLLLTIVTTVANDTFAYLIGSSIKGPKLCPLISPNKTISGAIGGLLGGIILGFGVYGIFAAVGLSDILPAYIIIVYTIIAGVISQIGDIFASIIKRRARTKDYSSIFPGHGGFMDRLDGISFNAIFTLFFALLFIL